MSLQLVPPQDAPLTSEQKKLVASAAGLVDRIAGKMHAKFSGVLELSELKSLGNTGLVHAAKSYDPELEVPFEGFAKYRVEGAILDGLREEQRQLPTAIAFAVRAASRKHLAHQADKSNVMTDTDEQTRAHLASFAQLQAVAMFERLVSESSRKSEPEPIVAERQVHARAMAALDSAVSSLSKRDRQIVDLYYRQNKELKEIAEILEVSYASVRRFHDGLLTRLNALLRGKGIHEAPAPLGSG